MKGHSSKSRDTHAATCLGLGFGAILGILVLVPTLIGCGEQGFEEIQIFRPLATPEQIALWEDEWAARADAHHDTFPDPPGEGAVETAEFWLSRGSYRMTIKRRGDRITLRTGGVDKQTLGGGWTAFGEGRIEAGKRGFAGSTLTFSWSCLGIRYRHASDGVGRIWIAEDGQLLQAVYVAHEAPELWSKAYGRRVRGSEPAPAYASIRGQIDYRGALPRLNEEAWYETQVVVESHAGAPVSGALVQIKGRINTRARTDHLGRAVLRFRGREAPVSQVIAAGRMGFLNGETVLFAADPVPGWRPGRRAAQAVVVRLIAYDPADSGPDVYRWQSAAPDQDGNDAMACGTCHTWHYHQWVGSRHARSGDNGLVQAEIARMRSAGQPAGAACAACHLPGWYSEQQSLSRVSEATYSRGPSSANHCDFCHKIRHVEDVHASGLNGSIQLMRPADPVSDAQLRPGAIHHVFGTAPDVTYAYMGAIHNGLFASSHLCAGCHQGGGPHLDSGYPKVDTFEEWRRWAAGEIRAGRRARSCQGCHMPAGTTVDQNGDAIDQHAWDAIHRTPREVHDHRFRGTEPDFARQALEITWTKERVDSDRMRVRLEITNRGAGHAVPTGTWTKHLLVGVWAGPSGRLLVPEDAAMHGPERLLGVPFDAQARRGDWAGAHGWFIGRRARSQERTVADFWRAEDLGSGHTDSRLMPGERQEFILTYAVPEGAALPQVQVRIVHRRGAMKTGLADLPWTPRPYDAPPEVIWFDEVR